MHYISGDIEGMSGFGHPGASNDEILRGHLSAAAEGMHDAGETFVRLRTWHGRPELPDYVEIVRGNRTEDFDLPGLTSEFSGLALVGSHGLPPEHAFGHAYRFTHMVLNGRKIGEITIQVLLAATRGVPTVLLAGSRGALEEVLAVAPEAITVCTREGREGDEGEMSVKVLDEIRIAAAEAVHSAGKIPPPVLPDRFLFEVPMPSERAAEIAERLPDFHVRRDGETVTIETSDFRDCYRFLLKSFDCCDEARDP